LVDRHIAQHAGQLVRKEEQQHDHVSDRPEHKQSCEAGPIAGKVGVQGQYMPVHPDVFGQKWDLQLSVTPVIPKLIKGNLFDF
jgi:hypothetical protein